MENRVTFLNVCKQYLSDDQTGICERLSGIYGIDDKLQEISERYDVLQENVKMLTERLATEQYELSTNKDLSNQEREALKREISGLKQLLSSYAEDVVQVDRKAMELIEKGQLDFPKILFDKLNNFGGIDNDPSQIISHFATDPGTNQQIYDSGVSNIKFILETFGIPLSENEEERENSELEVSGDQGDLDDAAALYRNKDTILGLLQSGITTGLFKIVD